MTKDELFEYLSKKYELDYIKGPCTGSDFLCLGEWYLVTNVDCAEGVVRIYDDLLLDADNEIWMTNSYNYYNIENLDKIEEQLDKLFKDYRNCLKKQKEYKVQQKVDKIKEMF